MRSLWPKQSNGLAEPFRQPTELKHIVRVKVAEHLPEGGVGHRVNQGLNLLFFVGMDVGEIEGEVRVSLQKAYPHKEGLELVELIHKVIYGLCETQDDMTLLQIIEDRISVSYPVGVDHHVIGEQDLSPFDKRS